MNHDPQQNDNGYCTLCHLYRVTCAMHDVTSAINHALCTIPYIINGSYIYIPALPLEGTIVIHILFVKLENSRINQPFHNECLRYFTVMLKNNLIWADCNSSRRIEVHLILVPDQTIKIFNWFSVAKCLINCMKNEFI